MKTPLRVLQVEDAESDAALIRRHLEKAGHDLHFRRVETAEELRRALAAETWDVVIADYSLPQFNAPAALGILQESGHDIPFIVVSGDLGEELAVKLMKAGAQDYLMKDQLARLAPAVARELVEAGNREQRRRAEAEVRHQRDHLEQLVGERTAELEAVSRKAVDMAAALQNSEAETRRLNEHLEELVAARTTALRESETYNKALFADSHNALGVLDPGSGRFTDCNAALLRMFGVPRREALLELTPLDLSATRQHDGTEPAAGVALHTAAALARGSHTFEWRHRRPDGGEWDAEVHMMMFPFRERKLIQFSVRDITERKRTEETLQRFRMAVEQTNEGVAMTDLDGNIQFVNRAWAMMHGCEAEEFLGNHLRVGHTPEQLRQDVEPFNRLVVERGGHSGEVGHVRKDGTTFMTWMSTTLLKDEAGRPVGFLGIARDITERLKQERMLQRSQRLESIGTLAGGIAHDLNNALAPIVMGLKMLKLEHPKESALLDMFDVSAKRSVDMVRQLLNFARGAEGERDLLEPGRLVRELERLMRGSFPKNLDLVVKCDPKLPLVLGDATQLHQVLLNLCVNARDAMPDGGTLTVEATGTNVTADETRFQPDAKPGPHLVLRVTDTGTGIPPEILDRIFDPFFTTKGPDKGTGLGLSTVAGIVKGHGGFLQVQSQPGRGSTFAVHLPVGRLEQETETAVQSIADFRGHGETILLVDDEANVREMGRLALEGMNLRPLTAKDGVDALSQTERHRTELRAVITDLHMPRMDGLQFVRTLRHLLPGIPVVIASGRLEEPVAAEFKALGINARLDKPFTEAQLSEVLRSVLPPE